MQIKYDPDKNRQNIENRKLSFEMVKQFEWETAIIMEDNRFDYGETRYCALGLSLLMGALLMKKVAEMGICFLHLNQGN